MSGDRHAQPGKLVTLEDHMLLGGIADVQDFGTGSEGVERILR